MEEERTEGPTKNIDEEEEEEDDGEEEKKDDKAVR